MEWCRAPLEFLFQIRPEQGVPARAVELRRRRHAGAPDLGVLIGLRHLPAERPAATDVALDHSRGVAGQAVIAVDAHSRPRALVEIRRGLRLWLGLGRWLRLLRLRGGR